MELVGLLLSVVTAAIALDEWWYRRKRRSQGEIEPTRSVEPDGAPPKAD
ncbi:hypothetical protein ACWC5I_32490 [Kitasatospora sp. NPDC001574]